MPVAHLNIACFQAIQEISGVPCDDWHLNGLGIPVDDQGYRGPK